MQYELYMWGGFAVFVVFMLALDLGVFNRKSHVIGFKESMGWTIMWVTLAMAFNGVVYYVMGPKPALDYFTGYILEKSLSVDNLFVILMVFSYFQVEAKYQHRVLFWGILGAVVMRGIFIAAGVTLIQMFHWVLYIFGAFLVFTGVRMYFHKEGDIDMEKNLAMRLCSRFLPVVNNHHGHSFFVKSEGKYHVTPLFIALIVIETSDVIFALDSIPAILAITYDPFIVFSSNVMAILGLRSLFFALSGVMGMFHYLHYGLAAILVFLGVKMLGEEFYDFPITWALGVIALILGTSIVASLAMPKKEASKS